MKKLAIVLTLVLTAGCALVPVNPQRWMKAAPPANPPKNCTLVSASPDSPLRTYRCEVYSDSTVKRWMQERRLWPMDETVVRTWGGGR